MLRAKVEQQQRVRLFEVQFSTITSSFLSGGEIHKKTLVSGGLSVNDAPGSSPLLLVTQLTYRSTRLVNL